MPAFFVHGVPETHHLWDGVRHHLSRQDIIAPDMPGFGNDPPSGFTSTKEEYLDWLTAEVEKAGEPVDIVGHDWGALLVGRLACIRGDLVRTWAVGGAAIDEGYDWHPMAKMWQTPGVGEQVMQGFTIEAMVTALANDGVPEDAARAVAERVDDRMKAAILPLYRSAVNYPAEWGPDVDKIDKPGMLIWGEKDPYMQVEFARKMAARTGAELVLLPGSHWWPVQFPKESAEALERLWAKA
jgi:pimeloyl-ACP methyl ester carboxylesterase